LNKGYGTFAGLKVFGFMLADNAFPTVMCAAVISFYSWLKHFLAKKDKQRLHFGTIFVEQLLYKAGCWNNHLYQIGEKQNLLEMAEKLFKR
jgi:hypothetical protein